MNVEAARGAAAEDRKAGFAPASGAPVNPCRSIEEARLRYWTNRRKVIANLNSAGLSLPS